MHPPKNSTTQSATRQFGFTIVELLIVIVVIAILAAVAVVAYTGVQQRARVSVAKNNLKSIGTTLQLYQSTKGIYPRNATELLEALGSQPAVLDLAVTNTGGYTSDAPNSFAYCYSDEGLSMWVAAWNPVTKAIDETFYYWTNGTLHEDIYTRSDGQTTLAAVCKIASSDRSVGDTWSHAPRLQSP